VNPADFVIFAENMVMPSIQMLKDWEDKKVITGGLFAAKEPA
jgi:hypothetical protein